MPMPMRSKAFASLPQAEDVLVVIARCLDCSPSQFTANTSLAKDLGVDSMDRLALAADLEDEFHVVILDRELHNFHSIGDVVLYMAGECEKLRVEEETHEG